jgi:hypothetical protein
VFVAKGRDGATDIWGLVWKPTRFDPSKKYPVIEYIYAGPHGTHTPKSFSAYSGMQAGRARFHRRQMDGMGTSNRSKAFHDVAWQNIKDAASPIASCGTRRSRQEPVVRHHAGRHLRRLGRQPEFDGRAALPSEFYKVAVSCAGCHDNRMDRSGGTSSGWDGRSARNTRLVERRHAHLLQASCC